MQITKDQWVRIIGIPVLGLFIPLLSLPAEENISWQLYAESAFISVVFTFFYWQGNYYILYYLEHLFPDYSKPVKRLGLMLISSILYNGLIAIGVTFLLHWVFGLNCMQNMWMSFLSGMTFTIIIASIYESAEFFQKWKSSILESERLKRFNVDAEYETLKNQVNPHFLFNSMNALSSLVHSDPDKAEAFIDEFSKIYRYVLDNKDKILVTLSEELAFVKSFLFLQHIRLGQSLSVQFNIPAEKLHWFLPPVSLQILVENALKHNVVSDEKPLNIEIYIEDEFIVVKNLLQPRNEPVTSTGVGLKNLKAKYKIISDLQPVFVLNAQHYTAKIPLLKDE